MKDLNKAQDQLDEKEKELEAVQAQYDQAMTEKQVNISHVCIASRQCRNNWHHFATFTPISFRTC